MYDDPVLEKALSNLGNIYTYTYGSRDYKKQNTKTINKIDEYMCSSIFIHTNGDVVDTGNYACHAGLCYPTFKEEKEYHAVASATHVANAKGRKHGSEHVKPFLEWLLNFSPYAPAFITKNINNVIETKFIIANMDVKQPLVAAALQSLRAYTEHSFVAYLWYRLVEAGVNPDLAYPIGYRYDGDKESLYTRTHSHCEWDPEGNDNKVIAFMKHQMSVRAQESANFRQCRTYEGSYSLWDTPKINVEGVFSNEDIREKLLVKKDNNEKAKNPFAKVKALPNGQGSIKEFVKIFKNEIEPLYLEKLNA